MTDAESNAEAERLLLEAAAADDDGRKDDAIALLRRAAGLGDLIAQSNLGVDLTNLGGAHRAEGIRWLKRSARAGHATAAWNLAMEHRLAGRPRAYLYWMRLAAGLGGDEAAQVVAEIDRRRARREPWFMLMAGPVDASDVEWMLDDVRQGACTPDDAAAWAEGVIHRSRAPGIVPEEQARLLPVLWELARGDLTPQRAAELLVKLSR